MTDKITFFSREYNEEHWKAYAACFAEADTHIAGIPQDIVNTVIGLLGNDAGVKWLTDTPLTQLGGMKAADILQMPDGENALKAFIMRLPC